MRRCGDCQLCCKLLAVPPLGKTAGQKCRYQKFGVGCTVYHTRAMPPECGIWNCRWLVGDDTADQPRPDRSHVVIDIMPDFVTLQDNETGGTIHVQIVQAWIDPKYPEAHRDPRFRAYVERRGAEGIATMVRYNGKDAITIFPPSMSEDGRWHEITDGTSEGEHSFADVQNALGRVHVVIEERDAHGQTARNTRQV